MINKILIRTSDRKTLHKDRRSLGMNGENLQEVLLFCLDEKIEGNGIVEVELPNGEKGMIEVESTEEGYELPVKSSLLTQTGFVKFQLRILHDNEEIFKSEIIPLEVKDSINATATIPEEYPSWVDTLTNLKKDLEKAESERVSNEEKRQSAEETRQENFTKMQETVSNAVSNIKDLTDKYNSNAEKETKKFNDNAVEQTKTFNDNSDSKLVEYNKKHTDKIKEYDDNSKAKLDAYNKNDTDKINAYNDNTVLKEKAYNDNAADKVKEYNTNVEQKETELEKLAEKKINEYNQVSAELTAKVEQVQTENEALKAENKLIKEQIPSATASGNSTHVEDSGTLDFDWKIRGGHRQETREGYNLLNNTLQSQSINGLEVTVYEDKSVKIVGTTTDTTALIFDQSIPKLAPGTYTLKDCSTFVESEENQGSWDSGETRTFTAEATLSGSGLYKYYASGEVVNTTLYPMLIKGSELKPYEQYGASPSPSFPSEIETINGSVEINVVNKNYLTKAQQQTKTFNNVNFEINENGEINIQGLANASGEVTFELERPCKMSDLINNIVELITEGTPVYSIGMRFLDGNARLFELIPGTKIVTLDLDESYIDKSITAIQFYINNTADYNLVIKPGIYTEFQTEFTPHQSQIAIIPIQQELLENDYIADVEHHEWKKLIITGEENIIYYDAPSTEVANNLDTAYFTIGISEKAQGNSNNIISNMFKNLYTASEIWGKASRTSETLKESISADTAIRLRINKERLVGYDNSLSNNEKITLLKNYLKSLYDEGNPVIVCYKLATPLNLELTEEQKSIRDTKLYTYKNITNISLSDELASIEVEYKKDLETEHNKLQNEIDEIKQLLSTTETSALLLDNLQKDVESEVE